LLGILKIQGWMLVFCLAFPKIDGLLGACRTHSKRAPGMNDPPVNMYFVGSVVERSTNDLENIGAILLTILFSAIISI